MSQTPVVGINKDIIKLKPLNNGFNASLQYEAKKWSQNKEGSKYMSDYVASILRNVRHVSQLWGTMSL